MQAKRQHISNFFLLLFMSLATTFVQAQNLGPYVVPFANTQELVNHSINESDVFDFVFEKFSAYESLNPQLLYQKESLGGTHYTFQCYYKDIQVEQVFIKVLVDFNNQVRLIQTTLPDFKVWNSLIVAADEAKANQCYLINEGRLVLAQKELVIEESKDYYANRFWLDEEKFFENILKYHNDTTAYAKVFKPDPLTSANVSYGGAYQDAFRFDTSALVIQNLNNSGSSTITANGTTYTYDGLTFTVPTESYVNNLSASIIQQVFEQLFLDGQGNILGFNTAITEDVTNFTTEIIIEDYNYPSLAQEQFWGELPLEFVGGSFNLANDFFEISEFSLPFTNPTSSATDTFDFTRNMVQFEDINAFYHLNNFKAYWESLGFTNLATDILMVDAHGNNGADNSFFSPTNPPRLVFGEGGVDDAEDADVIIHEYGHAISSFASPGSNVGDERRGLDEGFGDYLATTYSRQYSNFEANKVFTWDGHNEFWLGRISNSSKTKLDISTNQNIYYNGEIWSAVLNDLYLDLGANVTDQLAIEVMYYNMPNSTITQAAFNLFLADTLLFNGVHTCAIFDVLFERKFLEGTCNDFYSDVNGLEVSSKEVKLLNTYGFSQLNEDLLLEVNDLHGQQVEASLYDLNGKLLETQEIKAQKTWLAYKDLAPGIYFLHVRTPTKNYPFKLMKN